MTEELKDAIKTASTSVRVYNQRQANIGKEQIDPFKAGINFFLRHVWHDRYEKPNGNGLFLIETEEGRYDLASYSRLQWRTVKRWLRVSDITNE